MRFKNSDIYQTFNIFIVLITLTSDCCLQKANSFDKKDFFGLALDLMFLMVI